MDIERLLGIDPADAGLRHAINLVENERTLVRDLVLARKDAGLSQAEVGKRMGVTQAAVARIESGDRDPRLSTLRRYANAVGASIRHLVTPAREVEATNAAEATDRALRIVQAMEDPEESWENERYLPQPQVGAVR